MWWMSRLDWMDGSLVRRNEVKSTLGASIFNEFSENFQTASDPPPPALVSENYVALFWEVKKFCKEKCSFGTLKSVT